MSDKGIDMKIADDFEEEEILIIYKGNMHQGNKNEEEIIEIKSNKKEFTKRFRYFLKRNKEIEKQKEIFIHETFCTSNFKAVVDSLKTKEVEVQANNYKELLLISDKYEYFELSRTIHKFINECPDLEKIISSLNQKYTNTDGVILCS